MQEKKKKRKGTTQGELRQVKEEAIFREGDRLLSRLLGPRLEGRAGPSSEIPGVLPLAQQTGLAAQSP